MEIILSEEIICFETDCQIRSDGLYYLPNTTAPFTGKNITKYENGQYKFEGRIKDGRKDGKWTQWHENGEILSEINYKDGKKDGTSSLWVSGHKIHSVDFKDDKKHGKTIRLNEHGRIVGESNWKDGECISGDCPD
jgi:antitoxin component YwqK of YwqJK toxin-antitoxin module